MYDLAINFNYLSFQGHDSFDKMTLEHISTYIEGINSKIRKATNRNQDAQLYLCDVYGKPVLTFLVDSKEITFWDVIGTSFIFEISKKEWDSVSEEGKSLVSLLLNKNPDRRPYAHAVLRNIWFNRFMNNKTWSVCLKSLKTKDVACKLITK
jgi:serine/threonine protein kinase